MVNIIPLDTVAPDAVEQLLDESFGADRHSRTAYKLRAGTVFIPALSFAAVEGNRLLGTIQCWPTALQTANARHPMVLVGPVAVAPETQRTGLGKALMFAMLDAADASAIPGADVLMMIGDPDYYERFFGFSAESTGNWHLPGPFERHRLLARVRRAGGIPSAGDVTPDPR